MTTDKLKEMFGDEYPNAVIVDGTRLPLRRERRFSRSYGSKEHKVSSEVSRFMDGSASMTASELFSEWPTWTDDVRTEFCEGCDWLHEQADFPEMLRFIMHHGNGTQWCGIALSIASRLPQNEAFETLLQALRTPGIEPVSNLLQGIAQTKHPDAEKTLREYLATLWTHPSIWDDAKFINWQGFDATTCITHLIEVGAAPDDFVEQVRQLSRHVCSHNRDSCRNFLAKHYPWLT